MNLFDKTAKLQCYLAASTSVGASPTNLVRWGNMEKKYTDVQQPKSISAHNTSMGELYLNDKIDFILLYFHEDQKVACPSLLTLH
jgi:hypothetical protein